MALEEKRIITPLNSTFMLTSIIGFMVSAFYVPSIDFPNAIDFAVAFSIVFVMMFIASLISMTYAPTTDFLQIDEKRRVKIKL
jgi:hypothetical protein